MILYKKGFYKSLRQSKKCFGPPILEVTSIKMVGLLGDYHAEKRAKAIHFIINISNTSV